MSAKVANVIAVELGLLIAILSWLAFSNSSRLKPPALVEELRAPENSLAMVRPVPRQQQFQSPATYAANPQPQLSTGVQPAVQTNQGLQYGGMDYYGQSPAPAPYTIVEDTPAQPAPAYDAYYDPYYTGGYQQPTIPYPDDYYYSPNDYGYYPYPGQIIVVSNVARERSRVCSHRPPMQGRPGNHPGPGQLRPPGRFAGGRDFHSPGGLIGPRAPGGRRGGGVVAPRSGGGSTGGGRSAMAHGNRGRATGSGNISMPR